jgi:hypothetical protein
MNQKFAHTTSIIPDHCARVVFLQWLLTKCIVNLQFVVNILFADEAGFVRNNIMHFYNTHLRVDDNPHATTLS